MKRILTGITSSGNPHIGNYIGSVHNALTISKDKEAFYFVADLHGITVDWDPNELRTLAKQVLVMYLAAGFDMDKTYFFLQSQNPDHSYLAWLFNCITPVGWMNKMIQYKEKSQKVGDSVKMGLMDYPVLMASDILLYDPDFVPVGDDQTQHVELTRNIAEKFNGMFGDTFKSPEAVNPTYGFRIKNLLNPEKKMSKSDKDKGGIIQLLEDPDIAVKKIKKSVTDSENYISYDPDKRPGVSNLLDIYTSFSNKSIEEIVKNYEGKGYSDFKTDLADIIYRFLVDYQKKYFELDKNSDYLNEILKKGLDKSQSISSEKIKVVKEKMGFLESI